MKYLLYIIVATLVACSAHATFSKFVHVTPGIEDEKSMFGQYAIDQVVIIPLQKKDSFRVVIPLSNSTLTKQKYWRITCKAPCQGQDLNFRSTVLEYIYGKFSRQDIEKIEPLEIENKTDKVIRVDLSKDEMKRTYIYRDFPRPTMDGGYYYCVDIPAYYKQYLANQNLQPAPLDASDEVKVQGGAAEI